MRFFIASLVVIVFALAHTTNGRKLTAEHLGEKDATFSKDFQLTTNPLFLYLWNKEMNGEKQENAVEHSTSFSKDFQLTTNPLFLYQWNEKNMPISKEIIQAKKDVIFSKDFHLTSNPLFLYLWNQKNGGAGKGDNTIVKHIEQHDEEKAKLFSKDFQLTTNPLFLYLWHGKTVKEGISSEEVVAVPGQNLP